MSIQGAGRGRPKKLRIPAHISLSPDVLRSLINLAEIFGCSRSDLADLVLRIVLLDITPTD
jgi:hypothetical protein